ncbi:2,3-bisphosphoglycerate-dependent phosphoglycerate mutase [bacterium]|nr:2,3-bisphosphoglycerate-dependent phosphoglycerate mutase [bacterium]
MSKLVLVRHGQSEWNLKNLFTGWENPPLTPKGVEEAHNAGKQLKAMEFIPSLCFTSELVRAQKTLDIMLDELRINEIEIIRDKALNERHYGDLQGKNKAETAKEFGEKQVHIWRRSFDVPPPNGESLKDTAARSIPYFEDNIVPKLKEGKDVLVSAHGNSLRSIVMDIEKLSPEQILKREIATGQALVYEYHNGEFKLL